MFAKCAMMQLPDAPTDIVRKYLTFLQKPFSLVLTTTMIYVGNCEKPIVTMADLLDDDRLFALVEE